MSEDLKKIRTLIDKIDKQIVKTLNERAKLAKKIKKAKASSQKKDIFRPEREAQILRKIGSINTGPLQSTHLQSIFREIISSCLSLETSLKVSCLGPEQSYSNLALTKFFGSSVEIKFNNSISEIFDDVSKRNVDYGIVPIENSNQGSIKETIEHLIKDNSRLCGEVNLDIKHCLLSSSKKVSQIKKVYAHEQTFLQCNQWLNKNMPDVRRIFTTSNSAAVQKVSILKNSAAIASKNCSPVYKVDILKNNIHDSADNTTRFIVIGNDDINISGSDKTSILISIDNRAGALNDLLMPLSKNNISMSKIESIPTKINNWEYMFLLDIDGHIENKTVNKELRNELQDVHKFSIFHGLNALWVASAFNCEQFVKKRSDVVVYSMSNLESNGYKKCFGIMEENIVRVGIPRHDKDWIDFVINESHTLKEQKFEPFVFVIGRPASPYNTVERKKKALKNMHDIICVKYNLKLIVKSHPKESLDGIDGRIYSEALGLKNYGKTWIYSDRHPFVLGNKAIFAVSFYSGVGTDMLAINKPTIEYLDLSNLDLYDNNDALRDKHGEPVFELRYAGLVLGASSKERFSQHVESILNQREEVILLLYSKYKEYYNPLECASEVVASDIYNKLKGL